MSTSIRAGDPIRVAPPQGDDDRIASPNIIAGVGLAAALFWLLMLALSAFATASSGT